MEAPSMTRFDNQTNNRNDMEYSAALFPLHNVHNAEYSAALFPLRNVRNAKYHSDEYIEESDDDMDKSNSVDSCSYIFDIPDAMEFLNHIVNIDHPIDYILYLHISMDEKRYYIGLLLNLNNLDIGSEFSQQIVLQLTPRTLSKFLSMKEESDSYLEIYRDLIAYARYMDEELFGYNHLYHLIFQIWMDFPNNVSDDFRKKLILIGFGCNESDDSELNDNNNDDESDNLSSDSVQTNCMPGFFLEKIKDDIGTWLSRSETNLGINTLVQWLFKLDATGELHDIKTKYDANIILLKEESKNFRKQHGISKEEYEIQQQKSKKNGLCKFVRNGEDCPNKTKCIFYHGKLEHTYGIQICRNGKKCPHLRMGICKFVHEPDDRTIEQTRDLYKLFSVKEGKFLDVYSKNNKNINNQCLHNPFFILKKLGSCNAGTVYTIPKCECYSENQFGVSYRCNKPVKFMTKKNGLASNFYCCYEHMGKTEQSVDFVVKQNIIPHVFNLSDNAA